ncbi:MAG: hypothetical protein J7497_09910, partial [Chitinophagaceae bacterium]|nr:hypothetical protein [Chitinophagaceae bacterium]
MNLIRNEHLLTFFNENNNRILNKNNIEIKLRLPGRIIMSYKLEVEQKEKYSIVLQSEYKVLRNFAITHQVHSV